MLVSLALGLALLQPGRPTTDTTVTVPSGARLALTLTSGEVRIRTWDRNQVRIQAQHASRTSIAVHTEGAVTRIEARGRMGLPGQTDFTLTVPSGMAIGLDGMGLDVDAEGMRGALKVETLNGDVTVRDGAELDLSVMNGDLVVDGARGHARLSTVSGEISATGIQGEISAEAVSGGIGLYRITSSRVEAEAVSGEVVYQGSVQEGGTYSLASHSGSITFGVPAGANATINSSTFSGGVSASFSMPAMQERSRSRRSIRFGNGSATVDLESFSGQVRLVRPDEVSPLPPPRNRRPQRDDQGLDDGLAFGAPLLADLDLGGLAGLGHLAGLAGLASLGALDRMDGERSGELSEGWLRELTRDLQQELSLNLRFRRDRSAAHPHFDRQER